MTYLPYQKYSKKQENFDPSASCEETAKEQLEHISSYMSDFKAILDQFDPSKVNKAANRGATSQHPNAVQEDSDEDD